MIEKLDRMKDQREQAEQKLRYYQHQEKVLEHQIQELTRKARTRRLCTRGGMPERFLICPGELSNGQVMELLKLSFNQQKVALALTKMICDLKKSGTFQPYCNRVQLYTGGPVRCVLQSPLQGADDLRKRFALFIQGKLRFPCAG